MNKTFLLAWLVVFVVWFLGSFLVHGVLLHDDYMAAKGLFRSAQESQAFFPLMILAHIMLAGALAWIYSRGVEARPWLSQGLRFGVAVAFLTVIPTYLIYFVVQPIAGATVVKQILFDGVLMLILGATVAFMYRKGR